MGTSVNNKCKAFTSLEQSRKLAEFLPIESADMCFNISQRTNMPPLMTPYCKFKEFFNMEETPDFLIPCWSLAKLLDILPVGTETHKQTYDSIECYYVEVYNNRKYFCTDRYVNLLDACVKMIFALKQRNLL